VRVQNNRKIFEIIYQVWKSYYISTNYVLENVQFSEKTVKISPSSPELPVLTPSAYKVSGKVTMSAKGTMHFRKLSIQNTAATFYKELDTNDKTGEYFVYLAPDKYQLSVIVSTEEKTKGLQ